jgi:hypothetical protein
MARKQSEKTADPRWDRKQGVPKSPQMKRVVEQSSGRYSASEQSEQKKKSGRRGRRA